MSDAFLDNLFNAIQANPADVALRALYSERLLGAGRIDEAIGQALVVQSQDPSNAQAASVLERAASTASEPSDVEPAKGTSREPSQADVDWERYADELGSTVKPPFIVHDVDEDTGVAVVSEAEDASLPVETGLDTITLEDVGGLDQVKRRIRETFLDPIANPDIARAFKKRVGGGLLLYGPPGCGKTFIARAIAGELGAEFMSVTLADVLSKWLGESEQLLHGIFREARSKSPVVLFFDEVDALGAKRGSGTGQAMRNVINQLLYEMDGVDTDNDGLFILAATNVPWDVDPALLRPGRFDRTVLVLPPDLEARRAILRLNLEYRPVEGIDLNRIAAQTEGFSGADLSHLCETAAERALTDSIRQGTVRPITMEDLTAARKELKPSIGPWLETARNVTLYANQDGRYDDLRDYLKKAKRL